MRAFLGLWTAAMLLTAGFGAAGTSPERLIRVIYADAYGAAQVLDGRASLAAQWTEDALRAVWASGTQGLFPTSLGRGAHTRLPGWAGNDSRREADPIQTSLSRAAASPYIENLRLMGLLAIRRTARIAVYFLLSGVFLIALFADGMLERRIAHHRMTGGRPSLFAGLGFVPGGLIILSSVAALLPTVVSEWCFWVIPVLFGLVMRHMAARWHRLPR